MRRHQAFALAPVLDPRMDPCSCCTRVDCNDCNVMVQRFQTLPCFGINVKLRPCCMDRSKIHGMVHCSGGAQSKVGRCRLQLKANLESALSTFSLER